MLVDLDHLPDTPHRETDKPCPGCGCLITVPVGSRGAVPFVCDWCRAGREGERYCLYHGWLNAGEFRSPLSHNGDLYCRLCFNAIKHGTTVEDILKRQGVDSPECEACGTAIKRLVIHHDHAHCPGKFGCAVCVVGYLCYSCNNAEGYVNSPRIDLAGLFKVIARTESRRKEY